MRTVIRRAADKIVDCTSECTSTILLHLINTVAVMYSHVYYELLVRATSVMCSCMSRCWYFAKLQYKLRHIMILRSKWQSVLSVLCVPVLPVTCVAGGFVNRIIRISL